VALGTAGLLIFDIAVRGNVADHDGMATNAVVLQFLQIRLPDPDWFVKVLECEGPRMMPAILGFDEILVRESRRDMAVVAAGDSVMARFHPGIVLVIHDVAVLASRRVIAQIGETFGEMKREHREPDEHTKPNRRGPANK
jgi:hypothetical protein